MKGKTSAEIQEIFGLNRDDIRRLEHDGLLNPLKSGQGTASLFGESDLDRLFDIKMFLLAGYRISDMRTIITDEYDSSESIAEQIHMYKKRIQMLEFIQIMRNDLEEFAKLNQQQLTDISKVSAKMSNVPNYGTEEYFDFLWDSLKLIFITDFLCQKESFITDKNIVIKRTFSAYKILEKYISRYVNDDSEIDAFSKDVKDLLMDINKEDVSDDEIRELAQEIVEECLNNKDEILREFTEQVIDPYKEAMDAETAILFKNFMLHIFQFALDYFVDNKEIYCVCKNFIYFAKELDLESLKKGIVTIGRSRK